MYLPQPISHQPISHHSMSHPPISHQLYLINLYLIQTLYEAMIRWHDTKQQQQCPLANVNKLCRHIFGSCLIFRSAIDFWWCQKKLNMTSAINFSCQESSWLKFSSLHGICIPRNKKEISFIYSFSTVNPQRKGDLVSHLKIEPEIINDFNHQSYASYFSYQYDLLNNSKSCNAF